MFIQTEREIIYVADKWRTALNGGIYLFLAMPVLLPVVLAFYFDGVEDFYSAIGALLLLTSISIVALVICDSFRRISQPDRMIVSREGLTFCRYGETRHYPWQTLGEPIYISCGRGPGLYRMDILNKNEPVFIRPNIFGGYCQEIRQVIAEARQGRLPDVAEVCAPLLKSERQMTIVFGFLFITPLFILLVAMVFAHGGTRDATGHGRTAARTAR